MTATSAVGYIQAANVAYITRTCQTASSILVLYDHAITVDQEVDHIWTHPCSFGSIMYLLIRYIGTGVSILNITAFLGPGVQTHKVCDVYFFVQAWLNILVLFFIQLMLQVRLHALYQRSRVILVLMIAGYVCEIAAVWTIMTSLGIDAQITDEIQPGLYMCADTRAPSFYHQYTIWLPVITYDGMLCLLALWYGITHWMSGYRAKRIDGVYIADALIKGNATYCFCIILACIISVVIGQFFSTEWLEVSEGYPVNIEAMVGCRLTLNLRLLLVREVETEYADATDDAPWDALVHPLSSTLLV